MLGFLLGDVLSRPDEPRQKALDTCHVYTPVAPAGLRSASIRSGVVCGAPLQHVRRCIGRAGARQRQVVHLRTELCRARAGGNARLVRALADGLPILYHTPVQEVHYGSQGVTVVAEGGRALAADAVVVTVPLGVLKAGHIAFSPSLPAAKEQVIQRFGCASGRRASRLAQLVPRTTGQHAHSPRRRQADHLDEVPNSTRKVQRLHC